MAFDYEQIARQVLETHAVQRDVRILHVPDDGMFYEIRDQDYWMVGGFSVEVKNPAYEGTPADRQLPLDSFVSGLNCFVEPGEPIIECQLLAKALTKAWDDRWPIQVGPDLSRGDA